jgi:hypothetical protein
VFRAGLIQPLQQHDNDDIIIIISIFSAAVLGRQQQHQNKDLIV